MCAVTAEAVLLFFEQVWLTHQCMQMCEILNRVRGQGPTYMMSRTALSRFRPILNDSGFVPFGNIHELRLQNFEIFDPLCRPSGGVWLCTDNTP